MKIRLLDAIGWLATGFAVLGYAQQKDAVDPKVAQQIRALEMKYDEAFNGSESGTLAAL